jgi:hypothetical protein
VPGCKDTRGTEATATRDTAAAPTAAAWRKRHAARTPTAADHAADEIAEETGEKDEIDDDDGNDDDDDDDDDDENDDENDDDENDDDDDDGDAFWTSSRKPPYCSAERAVMTSA